MVLGPHRSLVSNNLKLFRIFDFKISLSNIPCYQYCPKCPNRPYNSHINTRVNYDDHLNKEGPCYLFKRIYRKMYLDLYLNFSETLDSKGSTKHFLFSFSIQVVFSMRLYLENPKLFLVNGFSKLILILFV